jgi:hypothetical protein
MGKTQSKLLAERHGRGTAGERHGMCESNFMVFFLTITQMNLLVNNFQQQLISYLSCGHMHIDLPDQRIFIGLLGLQIDQNVGPYFYVTHKMKGRI